MVHISEQAIEQPQRGLLNQRIKAFGTDGSARNNFVNIGVSRPTFSLRQTIRTQEGFERIFRRTVRHLSSRRQYPQARLHSSGCGNETMVFFSDPHTSPAKRPVHLFAISDEVQTLRRVQGTGYRIPVVSAHTRVRLNETADAQARRATGNSAAPHQPYASRLAAVAWHELLEHGSMEWRRTCPMDEIYC